MANGLFDIQTPAQLLAARQASLVRPGGTVGQRAGFDVGAAIGGTLPGLFGLDPELAKAQEQQIAAEEAGRDIDINNPEELRLTAQGLMDAGQSDLAVQLMDRARQVEAQDLATQSARQQLATGEQQLALGDLKVKEAEALAPFVSKRAHAQLRQADLNAQKTELQMVQIAQQLANPATTDVERAKLENEQAKLLDKQRQQKFDREDKHRSEYTKAIEPVQETVDSAESVISLLSGDTAELPQAQIAAVFKFMKGLDPRSTVREGEFAAVANAVSMMDRLFTAAGKVKEGTVLGPIARQQLVQVMTGLRDAASRKASDIDSGFQQLVEKRGLDIDSVRPARVQQQLAQEDAAPTQVQGMQVGAPAAQPAQPQTFNHSVGGRTFKVTVRQ